jgi:hypothetical protein
VASLLADLAEFVCAVCKHWVLLMGGIIGVGTWAVGAALEPVPVSVRWSFLIGGILGLFAAVFRAWRNKHREARPYDKETYKHFKGLFDALPENDKAVLERLLIERRCSSNPHLESAGFACIDPIQGANAPRLLNPEFEKLAARLVKEWRANSRRNAT